MKKLLITGFEPFGGEEINPSWEAVSRLSDTVGEYELEKLCIPVTYSEGARRVIDAAASVHPDVILCIGQAGGRDAITPELVGINLRYASIPDNNGISPNDEPIIEGGAAAHFVTIPARKIAEAINTSGIKSHVSYTAGAYVCNDVIYTLLAHFEGSATRVGFIHIPYSNEQNKEPSMCLSDMVKVLEIAILNIG
jgi:pyroglutamyl-peptidase